MSVHSCGPNCTQPLCVANRRIEEQQKHINTLTNEKLTLQAKVAELTAALKDIYSVTNDIQVMSIVMANLPQPKTIPAALKQEGAK